MIVAIKILESRSEKERNSIIKEANILKYLEGGHPSIPMIYDFFNSGALFFIIMEYLDGFVTLLDWINSISLNASEIDYQLHYKKREEQIKNIFIQIVSTVKYLYHKSIIHRDLKLENVMFNEKTMKIKIIDFGLAIYSLDLNWTTICGSLEYLAPEIIQDIVNCHNGKINPSDNNLLYSTDSEVWSIGIILYGIIYCKLPFYNKNKLKSIDLILHTDISYEPENAIYNANLKNLLKMMLIKDPHARINFVQVCKHPFFAQNNGSLLDL